jgi:hypothetical protein
VLPLILSQKLRSLPKIWEANRSGSVARGIACGKTSEGFGLWIAVFPWLPRDMEET